MYRVYLFRKLELLSEEWVGRALPLLPGERREKAVRYRRETDRKNCVVAYLMLKLALKECFGIREFDIGYGTWGKPYLKDWPEVYFNISHCRKGCGVIVADCPVGMDIEEIRPFSWDVAERVCCGVELEALGECGEEERARLFIRMWTRKESYVKWLGRGIGYDVRRVDTTRGEGFQVVETGEIVGCVYGERW